MPHQNRCAVGNYNADGHVSYHNPAIAQKKGKCHEGSCFGRICGFAHLAAEAAELAAKHTTMEAVDNNILIEKSTNADGGDHHELKLNDVVEIGSGANKVTIDGNNGTISTGNINMNGTNGVITADKITIDGGAGTIGGLTNTAWDAENITSGQAATEDQLKTVSDSAIKYDVDSGGTINKNKITLEGSNGTTTRIVR